MWLIYKLLKETMKKHTFFIPTLLLFFFLAIPSIINAKGAEQERLEVSVSIRLDNGDYYLLTGQGTLVVTPKSVFLKTYQFKVPDEAMEQIDFGYFANWPIGVRVTLDTGEKLVGAGYLNKAGILTVTVHKNGAGKYFPRGWF